MSLASSEVLGNGREAVYTEDETAQHGVGHLEVILILNVTHGEEALHDGAAFLHYFLILRFLLRLFHLRCVNSGGVLIGYYG